ncbi:MAG: glycosyltransferase family 2 protein [Longimicrobiales bacterium]
MASPGQLLREVRPLEERGDVPSIGPHAAVAGSPDRASDTAGGAPLISVVVPTYGHGHLILETLESVFAQTYENVEVIVINDGSPDDVARILAPLREAGRIRYIEQENRGQSSARNRGLELASGEFVAFLDDDDLWPPDRLASQADALLTEPPAVLAYGDFVKRFEDGRQVDQLEGPRPAGDVRRDFLRRNWLLSPGQALMWTSVVRSIGGFDPGLWGSDDWDLYIRLSRCGRFVHCPGIALVYRVHEQNASRRAVLHARNHLKVARRHIGWNLPLFASQQRLAANYFVPNLIRFATSASAGGQQAAALQAYAYALAFRPGLVARPWYAASVWRSLIGVFRHNREAR